MMPVYSWIAREHAGWPGGYFGVLFDVTRHHDYCSLVERRCRDFSHCKTVGSLYRMVLPIRI